MSGSSYRLQVASLLILGLLLEVACLEMVRIGDLRTGLFDLQDLLPTAYFSSLIPNPYVEYMWSTSKEHVQAPAGPNICCDM